MLTENRWEKIIAPQEKAKYRSIVPTVFSLLASVVEDEPFDMTSDRRAMETQSAEAKDQEAKEGTQMDETTPISSSSYSFNLLNARQSYGIFSRSDEDIYVRKDEDGVLSHFCPLDKDLDGVRDEAEDCPDQPMRMDYEDWMTECSLKSDEIPYLMAEPPGKSDDSTTDGKVSSVDSSTAMIYPLLQNQQCIESEDEFLQRLLQGRKQNPSFRMLDEKILEAWSSDLMSSDDNDFYVLRDDDGGTLTKYAILGDESDMEEFETNETEYNILKSEKDESIPRDFSFSKQLSINKDKSGKSSASEHCNESSSEGNAEGSQQRISSIKTTDEDRDATENKPEAENKPDDSNKQNNGLQSANDQIQTDPLKIEVKNATLNVAILLNPSTLKFHETLLNSSTKAREEQVHVVDGEAVTSLEDSNETEKVDVAVSGGVILLEDSNETAKVDASVSKGVTLLEGSNVTEKVDVAVSKLMNLLEDLNITEQIDVAVIKGVEDVNKLEQTDIAAIKKVEDSNEMEQIDAAVSKEVVSLDDSNEIKQVDVSVSKGITLLEDSDKMEPVDVAASKGVNSLEDLDKTGKDMLVSKRLPLLGDLSEIEQVDVAESKGVVSLEDSNEMGKVDAAVTKDSNKTDNLSCELHEEKLCLEKDEKTHKGKSYEDTSREAEKVEIESTDSRMKTEMNVTAKKPKDEAQENLSMEPVAMNLSKSSKTEEEQPDIRTALRFMTEVYPSKDDDFYFDTLSDTDVPLQRENPKAMVDKPTEVPLNLKSPNQSSTFKTEEEIRAVTRPRNKLSKFFSSFKKKLGKKE